MSSSSTNCDEVERFAALELDAVDLLRIEQNVVSLRHLVALDDLVAVDGPDAGHHLLIFDALARSARAPGGIGSAAPLLVAGNSSTGIETSASRI